MGYPKSELPGYALFLLHEFCGQTDLPFEQILPLVEKFYRTRVLREPKKAKYLRTEGDIAWYNGALQVNELLWLLRDGGCIGVEEVSAQILRGTMVILVTKEAVFIGLHRGSVKGNGYNYYATNSISHERFFTKILPEPTGMIVFQALSMVTAHKELMPGGVQDMIAHIVAQSGWTPTVKGSTT